MTHDEHSFIYNAVNGFIGVASSALSVITQFQTELDAMLKTAGSFLFVCISAITLYNLLKKKK
jgi:hypothetical protein